jgi:hypothetical protein
LGWRAFCLQEVELATDEAREMPCRFTLGAAPLICGVNANCLALHVTRNFATRALFDALKVLRLYQAARISWISILAFERQEQGRNTI